MINKTLLSNSKTPHCNRTFLGDLLNSNGGGKFNFDKELKSYYHHQNKGYCYLLNESNLTN